MSYQDVADARALVQLCLSSLLELGRLARQAADTIENLDLLDLPDLVDAVAQLKGPPGPLDSGIIGDLQTVARDLEDVIAARMSTKYINAGPFRVERTPHGGWKMDSRKVTRALVDHYREDPDIDLAGVFDRVLEHISGVDDSWKTTELRTTLDLPKPRYDRQSKQKDPDPLEDYGDRLAGRTTIRLLPAEVK